MVRSALALALIGLSAVSSAMPAPEGTPKSRRQTFIGDGGSSFTIGSGVPVTPCAAGVPIQDQGACVPFVVGGSIHPKKEKRFTLPPDWNTDTNRVIDELERQLEKLQNKQHKSRQDREEIQDIEDALNYLAGITKISAPPGTSSTFHPGKREQVSILGSYASECPNLEGAELALERLMQSRHLSRQERIIEQKLKSFLLACGVTVDKSPAGTSTTLKPSDKRDTAAASSSRELDTAGLENAHSILFKALSRARPAFPAWLAMQQVESTLALYGVTVDPLPLLPPAADAHVSVPRHRPVARRQTFTIGNQTCQLSDMIGLRAALAALYAAYGPPQDAPENIFLIEQVIVSALQLCGQSVSGWTTITPGNPIPGGPITPDPTQPGGPIKPDPSHSGSPIKPDPSHTGGGITPDPTQTGGALVPNPSETGGPIQPSDRRVRRADVIARQGPPISDPEALLAALQLLEDKYGTYGSGTIPVPIFLIMENIVTILQDIPNVVVPGWPILGAGSIHPSN